MSGMAHKTDVHFKFKRWHMQIYLERQSNIAYKGGNSGLIWNNFGFKVFDVQAEFPLSIGEG